MVRNVIGQLLCLSGPPSIRCGAYRPPGHFCDKLSRCDPSPMRKAISRALRSAPARRPAILIVTVFAVALLVRLAHLWAMRTSPFFNTLLGDAQSYDAWGRQIAGGDLVGHDVFYQAPLYAYFLGAIYTVRASVSAVRVCQAIVGALSCVLLARATEHLFGFTAGIVAGLSIVLLPIGVRNAIVGGEFHLTTAQSGPNLFIGNHSQADGTYVPLRAGRGSPEYERSDATDLAQRAAGRPLSPGEVSAYW